ncbi:PIN-like domain-containing protein [Bacillus cereus]|uniref:PIN-like domain-containing protein n=1 Tax=Bacillus cereus TaxID=1396 RepID=UPI0013D2D6E0|nr:PIN-like domain-containing protein [Bacillus cereus]
MKELFAGYIRYSDEEFKEIWKKAIFVVDTNVLLNFFKYSTKDTTSSFFDILKGLKEAERLYIPHHVALEFIFNYENVMNSQSDGINQLVNNLMQLKEEANTVFNRVKSFHPYVINNNFKFILDDLEEINQKLEFQKEKEIGSLPDVQELKKNLFELMDGIIGESYNQTKINEIEKEGKERYKHEVPPGWKDKNEKQKLNFRTYGGIRYQQLYGDLIVWNQMIDKVKNEEENTKPIIFITEEKKVDWWEKDESDNIKRPQPHLIQEFLEKTKQKFYMYRIDTFVKYAKEYLGADVSDEQMQNLTTQVENIRKVEEQEEISNTLDFDTFNEAFSYLSISERQEFEHMATEANVDTVASNFIYNNSIRWALAVALTKIEKRYMSSIENIKQYNQVLAKEAIDNYNYLPKDLNKRIRKLLKGIRFLDNEFAFYEGGGDIYSDRFSSL